MEYLICAKAFFKIPINGRMRAESWMKARCVAVLLSVEVAMKTTHFRKKISEKNSKKGSLFWYYFSKMSSFCKKKKQFFG